MGLPRGEAAGSGATSGVAACSAGGGEAGGASCSARGEGALGVPGRDKVLVTAETKFARGEERPVGVGGLGVQGGVARGVVGVGVCVSMTRSRDLTLKVGELAREAARELARELSLRRCLGGALRCGGGSRSVRSGEGDLMWSRESGFWIREYGENKTFQCSTRMKRRQGCKPRRDIVVFQDEAHLASDKRLSRPRPKAPLSCSLISCQRRTRCQVNQT